jgi:putative transposase
MCRPGIRRVPLRELPVLHTRSATITGSHTPPGVGRRPGGELLGLCPRTSPPGQVSHPDCRAVLIQIDAPQFGLPLAIRTDNGVPFASRSAFFGLSKLSVWWLRLGIGIERIKPGNPQQNGRHERMHLTLKKEATRPAGKNFLQQQAKFDDFMQEFNHERPHQALGMKYPAELYRPSLRPYRGVPEPEYPFHDRTVTVTHCGRICIGKRKINLSHVFAGQKLGIREIEEKIWLVSFMHYDLGFFDHETGRVECAHNPFEAKVLPMPSE